MWALVMCETRDISRMAKWREALLFLIAGRRRRPEKMIVLWQYFHCTQFMSFREVHEEEGHKILTVLLPSSPPPSFFDLIYLILI